MKKAGINYILKVQNVRMSNTLICRIYISSCTACGT
ncbi:hypothetical protein SLEP1_g43336 [Rubroshorea leprosula]|uniref:Uncharacterized protein n=1 Tax=Rubroshorea leprosula TaxID=152421 RepID=A0AAV5LCN2_9ROSI|nr:hypothetical protein SLEP1_g43336 [Rubroshorea leprosula]